MRTRFGFFLALGLLMAIPSYSAEAAFKLDRTFADAFAKDWVESWNAHDLERILAHYSDDIEMASPFIVLRGADPSGYLRGKEALSKYWGPAIGPQSTLKFELVNVLLAIDSIAIYYKSNAGGGRMAVEVFHFNKSGAVSRSYAHYSEPLQQ